MLYNKKTIPTALTITGGFTILKTQRRLTTEKYATIGGSMVHILICDDPLTHTVYSAGEEVHLPEMEYQLLYYFLQHPGQTLSRKTLMLAVWGAPPGLKTRTLDIHICQLRKKLKLGSSLQTVFKVGYKLRLPTNRNEGERCNP